MLTAQAQTQFILFFGRLYSITKQQDKIEKVRGPWRQ
jgi:hypothetical protein